MAKKDYKLPEIKAGMYMCWNVCTQTGRTGSVTLADKSGHVYFSYKKDFKDSSLHFLGQGHGEVKGELVLTIDCLEASELKQSIDANTITDNVGITVGQGYEFCIEDWTDDDYNDVYVDVVAWYRKG